MNIYFAVAFLVLAAFKGLAAFSEAAEPNVFSTLMAVSCMGLFGSPQLFWALKCIAPFKSDFQRYVTAAVAMVFLVLSATFGSFPLGSPPNWGGPAHFETPIGLVVEWIVALVGALLFARVASMNMPE